MRSTSPRWHRGAALLAALLAAVCGLMVMAGLARADGVPLKVGDVLASVGSGVVKHFDPSGNLLDTLATTTQSQATTGMCLDGSTNLFVTLFSINQVSEFDKNGNLVAASFGSGFSGNPESCVADATGDIYVSQPYPPWTVLKFDPSGNLLATYAPAIQDKGTDWVDLASDQCTLRYTSEGNAIKQFDVCTNTQLPDFVDNLPASPCYAHRILPDGSELVACLGEAIHVSAAGTVIKTYPEPTDGPNASSYLFAINLDPDGTSFWTGDLFSGDVWRIDIASGTELTHFNAGINFELGGLAVVGEITAALNHTLTVTESGSGSGKVTSSPPGISCPSACSAQYSDGSVVTLTAAADSGSVFAGWSGGGCSGTGPCTVTMAQDQSVTATFNAAPSTHKLTVSKSGSGSGTVTSSPAGIDCGTTCSASYSKGTVVTLTASPVSGSFFRGWSGACSGSGSCKVTMNADESATAAFDRLHPTSTSVSCSPSSVHPGASTSCKATVTDAGSSPIRPAGTVKFSSDQPGAFSKTSCSLSGGSGSSSSCSVTYRPTAAGSGTHTITASYNGDSAHTGSSGSTKVTVTSSAGSTKAAVAGKPSATTGGASDVSSGSARLHGKVNPDGAATTYFFEYGRTSHYGSRSSSASAGSGNSAVFVSAAISGLRPGVTYHYRIVARNSGGTTSGADRVFRTPQRASLHVSPSRVFAGGRVRVFGNADGCARGDRVTLLSRAFSSAHEFAGVPAIHATVGPRGVFSTFTRIPSSRSAARYIITARCGGGNLGVTARLTVVMRMPAFTG